MLKYIDTRVTFDEFPDEISLCINISNCPCHCPDCHSKYLWQDIGDPLSQETINKLIEKNRGITCIGLMGGDNDHKSVNSIAKYIRKYFPELKIGWYSGREVIDIDIDITKFNYIKLGSYKKEYGALDNPHTNQKMYKIHRFGKLENITSWFWRKRI